MQQSSSPDDNPERSGEDRPGETTRKRWWVRWSVVIMASLLTLLASWALLRHLMSRWGLCEQPDVPFDSAVGFWLAGLSLLLLELEWSRP